MAVVCILLVSPYVKIIKVHHENEQKLSQASSKGVSSNFAYIYLKTCSLENVNIIYITTLYNIRLPSPALKQNNAFQEIKS